jgi:hypothetical protein
MSVSAEKDRRKGGEGRGGEEKDQKRITNLCKGEADICRLTRALKTIDIDCASMNAIINGKDFLRANPSPNFMISSAEENFWRPKTSPNRDLKRKANISLPTLG